MNRRRKLGVGSTPTVEKSLFHSLRVKTAKTVPEGYSKNSHGDGEDQQGNDQIPERYCKSASSRSQNASN